MKIDNFLIPEYRKIGVMVSGGMDSGLLLYLIAREKLKKDYDLEIIAYSIDRKMADERRHSIRMIEEVEKRSDMSIRKKDVGGGELDSELHVIFGMMNAVKQEMKTGVPLDRLFLATTSVPEELKQHDGVPTRNPTDHWLIYQPWALDTKDQIISAIKDQELYWIIDQSHSCTCLGAGHCGTCYNCMERSWALSSNGLTDSSRY